MSRKIKNKKERRNHRPSVPEMLSEAFIKLSGAPANTAAKWIPLMIIVIVSAQPVSDAISALAQPLSNAIVALAGETTRADFNISAEAGADIDVDVATRTDSTSTHSGSTQECKNDTRLHYLLFAVFGMLFGVASLIFARRERRLKCDVIERKSERIRELETIIDPDRTSSGLTNRGETHPEDQ